MLWIPRSNPRPLLEDQDGLRVPDTLDARIQLPDIIPEEPEWRGQTPPDTPLFELPDWIKRAWHKLDADEGLATAVNAYYEAMRLDHHRHPSVAYLTYVAAIEGFGMRFVDDARCDCHPACTHMKGVAEKRFRKALKTILTNREVKQLAGRAYTLRSHTGHRGSLFGSEETFGYGHMLMFRLMDDFVFDSSLLGELRHISRRVLVNALATDSTPPEQQDHPEPA